MNRGSGLLFLRFLLCPARGLFDLSTPGASTTIHVWTISGREYEIGGSGEVVNTRSGESQEPMRSDPKHLGSSEGNVCLYSTTFYRRTYFFYLVVSGWR